MDIPYKENLNEVMPYNYCFIYFNECERSVLMVELDKVYQKDSLLFHFTKLLI